MIGNPKGVGLSHYNYIACCLQLFGHDPAQWTPENKVVTYTPYVHLANGTIPFFLGPWTGMMHVILPDGDNLKIAEAVQYNKATSVQVYAGLAVAMLETDLLERYDFSTVKYIVTGGLPFDEQGYKKFHTLGDWQTICVYGMTESAAWAAYQRVGEVVPQGKIGTLLPNMVGQLRTASGEDAPDGGPGELWLKGPNMTLGYVDNPEANKTAFDSEGWYNTGDICTFDGNGYIQLVGRTKELMKVSGFQVSPNELERYAYVHPAVVDIGVGPVYDKKRHTEVPAAYVVLKPHLTTDEEKIDALKNIQSLVDSQVSGYKKLRGGVWEVTSLPRNATHKLLRRNIADQKTGLSSLDSQKLSAKL
jgi:acyl-CoA synthetase (AMP-forming)/AMP-acid ligase II